MRSLIHKIALHYITLKLFRVA